MTADAIRDAFALTAGDLTTAGSFRSVYGQTVATFSVPTLDGCTVTGWHERLTTHVVLLDGNGRDLVTVELIHADVVPLADVIRSLMTLGRDAHLAPEPWNPPPMTQADHFDNLIDRAESARADR